MSINVDAIAPITPELLELGKRRADEIVKEWGRLAYVWGTGGTYRKDGGQEQSTPTIPDLAVACYVQGVRDAVAVAATREPAAHHPPAGTE